MHQTVSCTTSALALQQRCCKYPHAQANLPSSVGGCFSTHTRQAGEDPSTTTKHIGYSQLHWLRLRVIPGSLKHKAKTVHLYMKLGIMPKCQLCTCKQQVARLYKKCPWVSPLWRESTPRQADENYDEHNGTQYKFASRRPSAKQNT